MTPKTVDEAVNILIVHISLKHKAGLAKLSEDVLANLRLSLGIYIRDVFRQAFKMGVTYWDIPELDRVFSLDHAHR
jgi:hypothetical protein